MFFSPNKFDINEFMDLIDKKNNVILDFGSGIGIWDNTNLDPKIKKIFLYDPNYTFFSFIFDTHSFKTRISNFISYKDIC